jgi:hypothetical protein
MKLSIVVDAYVFFTLACVSLMATYFAYRFDGPWMGGVIVSGYALLLWFDAFEKVVMEDYGDRIVRFPEARARWRRP